MDLTNSKMIPLSSYDLDHVHSYSLLSTSFVFASWSFPSWTSTFWSIPDHGTMLRKWPYWEKFRPRLRTLLANFHTLQLNIGLTEQKRKFRLRTRKPKFRLQKTDFRRNSMRRWPRRRRNRGRVQSRQWFQRWDTIAPDVDKRLIAQIQGLPGWHQRL